MKLFVPHLNCSLKHKNFAIDNGFPLLVLKSAYNSHSDFSEDLREPHMKKIRTFGIGENSTLHFSPTFLAIFFIVFLLLRLA